ncbi:Hypothetical_protein [Hexamita inflata]|uniref:Hypothetical_protein n=1 Tax=Hexamita inflata TaxID=28002 RepID=A0AA86R6D5_9EUKA|nr:Hypothetical protein HINF_LOCUS60154 [Hexamita inflata]
MLNQNSTRQQSKLENSYLFKHIFNAISKLQPDKTRPNMLCLNGMENKQNLWKNGAYLGQTRYFMIIQEQALTDGEQNKVEIGEYLYTYSYIEQIYGMLLRESKKLTVQQGLTELNIDEWFYRTKPFRFKRNSFVSS